MQKTFVTHAGDIHTQDTANIQNIDQGKRHCPGNTDKQ